MILFILMAKVITKVMILYFPLNYKTMIRQTQGHAVSLSLSHNTTGDDIQVC